MWMLAANFRQAHSPAAAQRSVCIHQMNRVNSRYDSGHDDSTINIVMAIIIIITKHTHTSLPFVRDYPG